MESCLYQAHGIRGDACFFFPMPRKRNFNFLNHQKSAAVEVHWHLGSLERQYSMHVVFRKGIGDEQ